MRILWITLTVLLIDQATKITVFNTMYRGQSIPLVGDWLRFTFTENPGMAFGITFGPAAMVTVFSIAATILIIYYMVRVGNGYLPYRISLALVLGGAIGNIVDRVFYGKFLYGDALFTGKVIDFIHVNVWRGHLPDAIPGIGGSYLALFPIWNVADMAIVGGVIGILVFQKRFHDMLMPSEASDDTEKNTTVPLSENGKSSSPAVDILPEASPGQLEGDGRDPR